MQFSFDPVWECPHSSTSIYLSFIRKLLDFSRVLRFMMQFESVSTPRGVGAEGAAVGLLASVGAHVLVEHELQGGFVRTQRTGKPLQLWVREHVTLEAAFHFGSVWTEAALVGVMTCLRFGVMSCLRFERLVMTRLRVFQRRFRFWKTRWSSDWLRKNVCNWLMFNVKIRAR